MSASAITTSRRSRARSSVMAGCTPATSSARTQDGFFYFRSRVDDMFSCGGENVYPKEVENLLFAHPDVVNAVVAPVPHPVKGFVPAAMVIARAGSTVTAAELKALLSGQRTGLFASALYRHRRCAAAQRRRQDRPQRGAGQAQRRLCGGERRRRTVGEAKRSVRANTAWLRRVEGLLRTELDSAASRRGQPCPHRLRCCMIRHVRTSAEQ